MRNRGTTGGTAKGRGMVRGPLGGQAAQRKKARNLSGSRLTERARIASRGED